MLDLLAVQSSTTNATIITLAYTLCLAFILSSAIGWTYEKTFLGLSYSRNFVQGIVLSAVAAAMIMQAIGDKELLGVLDGTLTEQEALELVKLRSRQYAKRQLTWLRRNPAIHWIYWEKDRDFARALQISTEILTASGLG